MRDDTAWRARERILLTELSQFGFHTLDRQLDTPCLNHHRVEFRLRTRGTVIRLAVEGYVGGLHLPVLVRDPHGGTVVLVDDRSRPPTSASPATPPITRLSVLGPSRSAWPESMVVIVTSHAASTFSIPTNGDSSSVD